MNTPSAPTFLTKADMKLTAAVSAAICSVVELSTRSRRRIALSITPETATARLITSTDAMMMMTGTGETLERLLRRHDAGENGRRQGKRRDQVVAQPVGDEQDEHPGNDGQGFDLGQGQAAEFLTGSVRCGVATFRAQPDRRSDIGDAGGLQCVRYRVRCARSQFADVGLNLCKSAISRARANSLVSCAITRSATSRSS